MTVIDSRASIRELNLIITFFVGVVIVISVVYGNLSSHPFRRSTDSALSYNEIKREERSDRAILSSCPIVAQRRAKARTE